MDPYLRASVMRGERLDAETGSAPGIRTGWSLARAGEREELARRALETDAGRQFARCFGTHGTPVASLRPGALLRLADNRAVDRNDGGTWNNSDAHAGAVLRRHGLTRVSPGHLELPAVRRLASGLAEADRQAGLDWSSVIAPASELDDALLRAHARLPIDLDDPGVWVSAADRQRALGRRLGLDAPAGEQLSRWVLAHPDRLNAEDLDSYEGVSPPPTPPSRPSSARSPARSPSTRTKPLRRHGGEAAGRGECVSAGSETT